MPLTLSAQAPPVGVGSHVRITVTGHGEWHPEGAVSRLTADTIVVDSVAVARAEIVGIDVRTGTRRHALHGLGLGLLIGTGIGVAAGFADGPDHCTPNATQFNCFMTLTAGGKAIILGGVLGVAGAVIGTVAGALHQSDTWVPVDNYIAARLFTGAAGVGLSLTF